MIFKIMGIIFLISVIGIIIYKLIEASRPLASFGKWVWNDIFGYSLMSLIICVLIALISWLPIYIIGENSEQKIIDTKNIDLIALNDASTISGSFYLGCGNVNGKMEYRCLYNTDKGITQKSVDANSSYIKEYSGIGVPYVEVRTTAPKNNFLAWLSEYEGKEYIFYLPKGSIKIDYNVNLKGD